MTSAETMSESAAQGKKDLSQCFQEIQGYFSPKVIGKVHDVYVKVTKVKGDDVPWHTHDYEDELFYIFKDSLVMEIADKESFPLNAGELFIVKKGIRHRLYSTDERWVLLVDNKQTKHTDNVTSSAREFVQFPRTRSTRSRNTGAGVRRVLKEPVLLCCAICHSRVKE